MTRAWVGAWVREKTYMGRLNDRFVQADRAPGRYSDGDGLYLQVSGNKRTGKTSKSWVLRYKFAGHEREMGLGSLRDVRLSLARKKAQAARELRATGVDPIGHRDQLHRQQRLASQRAKSFKQVAEEFIESRKATWKNVKHASQWTSTLQRYVYPGFGSTSLGDVTVEDVTDVLKPIWTSKPETARRVRGRIAAVLDYAAAQGLRSRENPARRDGFLAQLLPRQRRQVEHHNALPFAEAPAFVQKLCDQTGVGPKALKFAILTAARTGEVVGAKWSEIDFKNRVWLVPAARMKVPRRHRVPLSTAAVDLLRELDASRGRNEYIFGVPKSKKPPSNIAMLAGIKRMGFSGRTTTHGFRSTFRDWADEKTEFGRTAAEAALAHSLGSDVETAYLRTDHFEKRKELMQKWSDYLIAPTVTFDASQKTSRRLQL
jgi:integrase